MAVREISYHDTFRLLRQHAAAQLLWAPESCAAEVATAGSLDLGFAEKGASCSVYPDHLQPLEALDAAGLVGKNLDEAGVKAWLAEKQGKEITVGSTTGVPTHFVVVQDGAKPQVSGTPFEVSIRSVRDGEEVTVSDGSSAVLVPLEVEGGQLGQLFSGAHAELQQALLELCRSLHVTELRGTFIPAAAQAKYVVHQASMQLDETASYLCASKWGECRFPVPFGRPELPEESAVHELDSRTGASLKFSVLNRNGRVWTLIAGGGASVVYTDTICEYGFAKELANYGEYSGDPPEEFVYEYSKTVLSVMTASPEPQGKVLLIGGGVANFTDVASTFKGIVKALKEFGEKLRACGAKVWVRRGGPNYAEGLATMRKACEEIGVPAQVYGPEAHLTSIVRDALGQGKPLAPLPPPKVKMPSPGKDAAAAAGKLGNGFATLDVDMQAIVYGLQAKAVQRMLDFDTLCGRKTPSVLCVINPTGEASYEKFLFGSSDVLVPVYTSVKQAVQRHGEQAQMLISFASYRSAYDASLEALEFSDTIRTHAIIAEGVPEALTRRLHQAAAKKGVAIIGPATVGGIMPGRFRIGNAGGAVENLLLAKLYRAGSCSYTTKSGGMSNELNNIVALNTDGVREGIAIGGDRWPGVRFIDVLLRFEADPNVKMMALLGEVGGREEYSVAEAIADGRITKPVVAWCCGTAAEAFDYEVQFGHAGARARSSDEKAGSKNRALAEAGAHVPRSFDEFGDLIAQVYKALVDGGAIVPPASEPPVPTLPTDYEVLKKKGQVRKSTNFVCSISDDRGAEPTYGGVPVSEITADPDLGIGGVISLLWLRRRLPQYATKFLELCIIATADHGPCVSGAHNTIVAARAGKDLVSSLISGLATIGPRFGGALDDAAKMLSAAHDAGLSAADFVEKCKAEKKVIMGIGHRVKSINNPDARVVLIKDYAKKHFQSTALLDFGVAVEAVTTKKKANLILNVDGAMACCVVDMLRGCGFSKEETSELVDNGVLNGIFVAARTLGLIGHFLDQRRLKQPLYRHPYDDITYISS